MSTVGQLFATFPRVSAACVLPASILHSLVEILDADRFPPTLLGLADAVNQAFEPPAVYMWLYGAYFTSCDAIAPQVAVVLDGVKFFINPVDLIYRTMVDPLTGLCMTAIASGGSGPYILGDVFMQNALVVFDVGQAKMRFIPRQHY